ncbi:thiamine biosynthesis protein ThiS [Methylophaga frappieri]|uniref:Thiamine biosynthesis protein ThiS n=1 Tax=Methylophaga frappieri (strain ATCC BAA-2434 / DSM 25690 / JAM7) TaxID=754477 RepID=I1YEH5_METFJ|nr:sulfur carrier protein ThiS [Methylophaga frappieri]AFJ01318.1 thiamine biosynthesis protein ThiS [Methylophaga frappieri]
MQIILNEKSEIFAKDMTLDEVLTQAQLNTGCFVAVVNGVVVPKTALQQYRLHEGDRIEILSPITGG